VIQLVENKSAKGLAPTMFWIYLIAQTASMVEGFRVKSLILIWGMIASMAISVVTISLIYYYGA
jgi:hypothetical protein